MFLNSYLKKNSRNETDDLERDFDSTPKETGASVVTTSTSCENNVSCKSHKTKVSVSKRGGPKDQDLFVQERCHTEKNSFDLYAVVDGHGVINVAAEILTNELGSELAKLSKTTSDKNYGLPEDQVLKTAISNIESRIELQLRELKQHRSGACIAGVLIGELNNIKIFWVGDCRAVVIDKKSRKIIFKTEDHRPKSNKKERERILEQSKSQTPRPGLLNSELWQAFEAESKQKNKLIRRQTYLGYREEERSGEFVGDLCVFAHTNGVSLQVTRSVGDPLGPRSVTCEPEIKSLSLENYEEIEIILGSDGFWDVFTENELLSKTPQKTEKLVAQAEKRRARNFSPDDISLMIIEIRNIINAKYDQNPDE